MARSAAAPRLTEDGVKALWGASGPTGPLPALFLHLPAREDGTAVRAAAFLLRLRSGGFMVAVPDLEEIAHLLQDQEPEEEEVDPVALYPTSVNMETPRGRFLGEGSVLLADLLWPLARLFTRGSPLRSQTMGEVLRFTFEDQAAKPSRAGLEQAADQWIHEAMDEDTAADYVTVDGGAEPEAEELGGEPAVYDLQRRVLELEALVARHNTPQSGGGATSSAMVKPPPPPGVLFSPGPLTPDKQNLTMTALRQMAGAAPPRLGAHERAVREGRPVQFLETLQQEEGLEAVEAPELEEGLKELEASTTDPLQRMLVLQMKQMHLISKQHQDRKTDPLHAALGGSETNGAGAGVKGCLARDAYVKLAADIAKVGSIAQTNAAVELGLDPHQVGSGLMREYLEKRCPLGDQRLLTQVGYLFASAWEHGFRTNNPDLMGHAARGMIFVDQAATDFDLGRGGPHNGGPMAESGDAGKDLSKVDAELDMSAEGPMPGDSAETLDDLRQECAVLRQQKVGLEAENRELQALVKEWRMWYAQCYKPQIEFLDAEVARMVAMAPTCRRLASTAVQEPEPGTERPAEMPRMTAPPNYLPMELAKLPATAEAFAPRRTRKERANTMARELSSQDDRRLRMLCLTWNVGATLPQRGASLEAVLDEDPSPDICVIGFQETCQLSARRLLADGTEWKDWQKWADQSVKDARGPRGTGPREQKFTVSHATVADTHVRVAVQSLGGEAVACLERPLESCVLDLKGAIQCHSTARVAPVLQHLMHGEVVLKDKQTLKELSDLQTHVYEAFLREKPLLELQPPLVVAGSIHGCADQLHHIFRSSGGLEASQYLFLGNYVSRGKRPTETFVLLLLCKLKYPSSMHLLRGRQECQQVQRIDGFFEGCKRRLDVRTWKSFCQVWNSMPYAAVIQSRILPLVRCWRDFTDAGIGHTFGPDVLEAFLGQNSLDALICSQRQVKAVFSASNARLWSVFSASNYCGEYENQGAVLLVDEALDISAKMHDLPCHASTGEREAGLQEGNDAFASIAWHFASLASPVPSFHDLTNNIFCGRMQWLQPTAPAEQPPNTRPPTPHVQPPDQDVEAAPRQHAAGSGAVAAQRLSQREVNKEDVPTSSLQSRDDGEMTEKAVIASLHEALAASEKRADQQAQLLEELAEKVRQLEANQACEAQNITKVELTSPLAELEGVGTCREAERAGQGPSSLEEETKQKRMEEANKEDVEPLASSHEQSRLEKMMKKAWELLGQCMWKLEEERQDPEMHVARRYITWAGASGNYKGMKQLLEKALEIFEKHNEDHPETALTLICLSRAYQSLGDNATAKVTLSKAINILSFWSRAVLSLRFTMKEGPSVLRYIEEATFLGRFIDGAQLIYASYPGKFKDGWYILVKDDGEYSEESVACVYCCTREEGLGVHVPDPFDSTAPCYCRRIYGKGNHTNRNFEQFGYLYQVGPPYDEERMRKAQETADAMNAVLVRKDAKPEVFRERVAEATKRWEDSGEDPVPAWGCKWYDVWYKLMEKGVDAGQVPVEEIIIDSIQNAKGLEQLIIIAVGMDAEINSKGDAHDLATRCPDADVEEFDDLADGAILADVLQLYAPEVDPNSAAGSCCVGAPRGAKGGCLWGVEPAHAADAAGDDGRLVCVTCASPVLAPEDFAPFFGDWIMKACAEMSLEEKVFERIHWDSRGRCAHAQHLKEGSLGRVGVTEEVHEADNSKDINVDSTYDINITCISSRPQLGPELPKAGSRLERQLRAAILNSKVAVCILNMTKGCEMPPPGIKAEVTWASQRNIPVVPFYDADRYDWKEAATWKVEIPICFRWGLGPVRYKRQAHEEAKEQLRAALRAAMKEGRCIFIEDLEFRGSTQEQEQKEQQRLQQVAQSLGGGAEGGGEFSRAELRLREARHSSSASQEAAARRAALVAEEADLEDAEWTRATASPDAVVELMQLTHETLGVLHDARQLKDLGLKSLELQVVPWTMVEVVEWVWNSFRTIASEYYTKLRHARPGKSFAAAGLELQGLKTLCSVMREVFRCMPLCACLARARIFCVSSGLSPRLERLEQLDVSRPVDVLPGTLLSDLLWSNFNPMIEGWKDEVDEAVGDQAEFGSDVLQTFLAQNGLDTFICSQRVSLEGYERLSVGAYELDRSDFERAGLVPQRLERTNSMRDINLDSALAILARGAAQTRDPLAAREGGCQLQLISEDVNQELLQGGDPKHRILAPVKGILRKAKGVAAGGAGGLPSGTVKQLRLSPEALEQRRFRFSVQLLQNHLDQLQTDDVHELITVLKCLQGGEQPLVLRSLRLLKAFLEAHGLIESVVDVMRQQAEVDVLTLGVACLSAVLRGAAQRGMLGPEALNFCGRSEFSRCTPNAAAFCLRPSFQASMRCHRRRLRLRCVGVMFRMLLVAKLLEMRAARCSLSLALCSLVLGTLLEE
eukprot:g28630.t2